MKAYVGMSILLMIVEFITANSKADSLTMYMTKLNQTAKDNSKSTNMTSDLAVLHCNVYCNGTSQEQIVKRECWSATPTCRPCQCDDLCHQYGDCCPDKDGAVKMSHNAKYICVGLTKDKYNVKGYFMVATCPDGFAVDPSKASSDIAPVTSLTTNITYINSDIALCNNDTYTKCWKKEEDCMDTSISPNFKHTDCVFNIHPPLGIRVRTCSPSFTSRSVIDSCNVTSLLRGSMVDPHIQLECREGPFYPVVAGDYIFKNIYCFLCNGLQPSSTGCLQIPETFGTSMDILVDLNRRPLCGSDEWLDKHKNVCRHLYCRSGYELKERTCVSEDVKLTAIEFNYDGHFWPVNPRQSSPGSRKDVEALITKNLPSILAQYDILDFLFTIKFMTDIDSYDGAYSDRIPMFGLHIEFRTKRTCCKEAYEQMISDALNTAKWSFENNNTIYEYTMKNYDLANLVISESQVYQYVSTSSSSSSSSSVVERIEAYSSLSDTLGEAELYLSIPITKPDCPFIYLHSSDFKWDSNRSVFLQFADIIVPSENITRINDRMIVVCKSVLDELYKNYEIPMNAKDIVTVFFSTLSLICLTLTLITYSTFPALLTLPAKNTMCLVVSLFLAQMLLIFEDVARPNDVACKSIGVLIHYSWLCVIFWMNVCSFHMFHVFVIDAAKPITLHRNHKRLLQYILYANGTPAVIVLATITANLVVSSGSQIGYGDGPCYLSTALLTGVCFVLPLGIVLILNVIFFGMSVWTMAKISKMSDTVGKDRNQVHIYIKLSTLTGVFWIFSILAEFLNMDVFIFISIILNASQGVFIFISYVVTKRIMRMWKSKLGMSSPIVTTKEHTSTRL